MPEDAEKTLKIRFRFPGGEEFEAEGTLEFIEKQRNYFLDLIGKQPKKSTAPAPAAAKIPNIAPTALFTPAPQAAPVSPATTPAQEAFPAKRLWETLLKEEGCEVILRRKMRLEPQEAALLLLAGARVLLNQAECKALSLSQMLQKSGFTNAGRLDRLLQQEANNGDIVVAMIDDSATVKRFYKENGHFRLQPENDYMEPILVYGELQILGKVIGVFRFMH